MVHREYFFKNTDLGPLVIPVNRGPFSKVSALRIFPLLPLSPHPFFPPLPFPLLPLFCPSPLFFPLFPRPRRLSGGPTLALPPCARGTHALLVSLLNTHNWDQQRNAVTACPLPLSLSLFSFLSFLLSFPLSSSSHPSSLHFLPSILLFLFSSSPTPSFSSPSPFPPPPFFLRVYVNRGLWRKSSSSRKSPALQVVLGVRCGNLSL